MAGGLPRQWSYKPMFTENSLWPRMVLWVLRTYNTVLVASGEYTTRVCSLPQHSWGECLLTSFYRERSGGSAEQRNMPFLSLHFVSILWVSCYILWSAIVTIICCPGRNNKIQTHDNGLIKNWWGAKASNHLKKCCSQESRSAVPSPVPPLGLSVWLLLDKKALKYATLLLFRMPLDCWLVHFYPRRTVVVPFLIRLTPIVNCKSHLATHLSHLSWSLRSVSAVCFCTKLPLCILFLSAADLVTSGKMDCHRMGFLIWSILLLFFPFRFCFFYDLCDLNLLEVYLLCIVISSWFLFLIYFACI